MACRETLVAMTNVVIIQRKLLISTKLKVTIHWSMMADMFSPLRFMFSLRMMENDGETKRPDSL